MNLFGLQIGKPQDAFPTIGERDVKIRMVDENITIRPELRNISIPEEKKPANIQRVGSKVLKYNNGRSRRGDFEEPEYDMYQVARIEDTDSYVAQAFLKKIGLLFKEGYEFVGANPRTIAYIKLRFEQIARASGIPTSELIKSIGASLIKKSNAFLIKARKESSSGGRARTIPGTSTSLVPIAGYFIAPPETMEVDADKYGKIRRWKQVMPNGEFQFFRPEDVIHFYFNRKEGLIFGTPTLVPVVDDIRALRKIEENVELLVYQHLFPLFHYSIGSDDMPAGVNEFGEDEISVARREIQYMPSEGGLVTSHRHKLELIGSENRALRAEVYLEHFKKRVFSGLGISAVDMGEGECYDESTQTLTENGWKFHWAIDHDNEKIATYNPVSKKIEFHIANYKYEAPYVGKMVKFSNRFLDLMVTPSHDMWVKPDLKNTWMKMTAEDLLAGKAGKAFYFLQSTAFWDENVLKLPHSSELSVAKLAALVTGLGTEKEGSIYIDTLPTRFGAEHILGLLQDLDLTWELASDGKTSYVKFDADVLGGFFKQFLSINAFTTAERFELPLRKAFVTDYVRATFKSIINRAGRPVTEYKTTTRNKLEVDIIQRLIISAGYSVYVDERVNEEKGHHFSMAANLKDRNSYNRKVVLERDVEVVDFQGIIYCYNVPNHLFVTRRNDKVTVQGNTANRATSDNMSRNLVDSVKDIQRTVESQVNDFLLSELLLESTFEDALSEENKVYMKFKEIDLDHQIKKDNHFADLFAKNAITLHEARTGMERQPFAIPTRDEIESQDNIEEQYPEWYATMWKLIEEPKALIQSIDEPYTLAAKAAAQSRSTNITESDRQEVAKEKEEQDNRASERESKAAAANKAPAVKDYFLTAKFNELEQGALDLASRDDFDFLFFRQAAFSARDQMQGELKAQVMASFAKGYTSLNLNLQTQVDATIRSRGKLEKRVNFYVERLMKDTIASVKRQQIENLEKSDRIQKVKAVFDSLRYRNRFIEDVELRRAHNLGFLEAARDQGFTKWKIVTPDDACGSCKNAAEVERTIENLDLESIPPLHANARAEIEIIRG